jgi:hypothetical protein
MEEELVRRVSNLRSSLDKADQEELGVEFGSSMDDIEIRDYMYDVIRETKYPKKGNEE